MNSYDLKDVLSAELSLKIDSITPLSGGDISDAFCLETGQNKYFLKLNHEDFALDMFQKEQLGLEQIAGYDTIKVPQVFNVGTINGSAYVLMEFIQAGPKRQVNFNQFGIQLAKLHLQFGDSFGWQHHNYIGSLAQFNSKVSEWNDFYINERIAPQIKLAIDQNLLDKKNIPTLSKLMVVCNRLFLNAKPSPLHGDLWSGNFINDLSGTVYLIDPAFYFGYHEVDIAMSQLFGGFSSEFYEGYYSIFPKKNNHAERLELLQLYYLLVHLNLFGKSYVGQVMSILNRY